ncbi:transglycosylase SLT domain-containing protein [Paraburkholderia sp. BL17N1]|uniref:transglycosylase SLT domain-containing protein n=1 Tax=Paraburkholderia sp. BL17N1 TaxID=1938798 RepID=UPI000EAE95B8|nr:transglycosylase SLT domain-containing protein [Paraburkholderia sp. BL17N1]RKR42662.1 transglycosylase-like protein with SLT domain [Paraburkholderia sp. BL17N1]
MPIDDLYAESTSQYLAGSNQVNVPAPQTAPSTSISSIARAVGRGFGQGALQFGGGLSDTVAGASQIFVDPDTLALNPNAQADADKQINDAIAKQRAGHLFESQIGISAYDLADTLKPDPTNTTATDQIVQGAVGGLTQLVPSTLLFGPVGGAVAGGASIGMARSEDLKRQGVDVGTRTAVGAVEGALSGVGAVLPVAGSTIARTAGLVAVGGPGMNIAQGVAEKAILRNANYDHLADQIDPLDPTSLAASTLVAGVFAGAHAVGTARAAKAGATAEASAAAPKAAPVDVPLTDLPVDTRKALRYNAPQLDAYATQAAQAAGVPPEMLLFIKNKGEQSNSNQVSPAGAKGVMQFTDPTFAKFGKGDPTDPVNSIDAAAAYAKDLLQRYDGDVRAAITEYNGGVKQAEAVHAGGAPTDPETIKYLRKYDRFAATQQINSVKFNATPDQVDAALVSHGQNMVDDANILPETDVAGMAAHQDAFELAANQMSGGSFPSVADGIPADATSRVAYQAFERDIATAAAPARASEIGGVVSVSPETMPGHENTLEPVSAVLRSDSGTQFEMNRDFRGKYKMSVDGEDAGSVSYVRSPLDEWRVTGVDVKPKFRRQGIASAAYDFLEQHVIGEKFARTGSQSEDGAAFRSGRAAKEESRHQAEQLRTVAEASRLAPDSQPGHVGASGQGGETSKVSPVESNVREAAQQAPDTPVHLDSSDPAVGEHNGTLASALEIIDNEHAATVDDAKLFSVAANCFIATGF